MAAKSETCMSSAHAELLEELKGQMSNAARVIEKRKLTLAEAREIAECLTEMRHLLTEWANIKKRFDPSSSIGRELHALKNQFLELEGAVKEHRNALEREQRSIRL